MLTIEFHEIIQNNLLLVEKPAQYINKEWNSLYKDFYSQKLKIILAFPDMYEIGMSNLGQKILYFILNSIPEVIAERVYAPRLDMEKILRDKNTPLLSLESGIPINDFDLIGFTLQNETSYTTVLNMLNLSKIPIFSAERDLQYPLVIAGGPCTFNPEPMALFFDAFVIGDGEEAITEIAEICKEWKNKFQNKKSLLFELSKIKGVYIPSLYTPKYNQHGDFECLVDKDGHSPKIEKRILSSLDKKFCPTNFLVPYIPIIHDRAILEISRGCTRGCRFCQAGMTNRPIRNRNQNDIVNLAKELISKTGYEEISLSSLCAGDFPGIEDVVKELLNVFNPQKVSVSLPSQRLDNFSLGVAEAIQNVRKTGLTFAPEAGSQRLRDAINKGITSDDLNNTISGVFKHGWKNIKLYFMIGLPTETESDIESIVYMTKELYGIGRKIRGKDININVAISPFIPKAHTPFQWIGQENRVRLEEKLKYLKSQLKHNIKYQPINMNLLEAVLARGDRRLSYVIKRAWEKGAKFDSWDDHFRFDLWQEAFSEQGLDMGYFANRNIPDFAPLPWEHILTGVSSNFLRQEYKKALLGERSDNCKKNACQSCGMESICSNNESRTAIHEPLTTNHEPRTTSTNAVSGLKFRIRIKYTKTGMLQYISHLDLIQLWNRALRRSGLPIAFSQGFNPQMIFSFGTILPLGIISHSEYLELELSKPLDICVIKEQIQASLPADIEILEIAYCKNTGSMMQDIFAAAYLIQIPVELCINMDNIKEKINKLMASSEILVEKKKKDTNKLVNIRPGIIKINVLTDEQIEQNQHIFTEKYISIFRNKSLPFNKKMIHLQMLLSLKPGESIRPQDVISNMFGFSQIDLVKVKFIRSEVFFAKKA
ncbi:TIGR03960 family B12-binding radical SAM protein [Candidatus Poribacteria bacterium]|nr:TIGR03960 family B12-binding radical SAM protein [Candidatus Poribacteria bacterium]